MASIALGAIFLASCTPKTGGTTTTAQTATTATTPAPIKVIDTIFVPGTDDLLHARKVSFPALDTQLKSGGSPIPALDEIIKLAPQYFPKGTRVEDVKENGGIITVLMNTEFGDAKHWRKGEKITELAVYSLVNTLAKGEKTVTLTLEGKPISTLGEFDASGALKAEPDLNAAPVPENKPEPAKPQAAAKASEKDSASANSASAPAASSNSASTPANPG